MIKKSIFKTAVLCLIAGQKMNVKNIILVAAVLAGMTACGNNGLPKNDILGNIPSLIYQKAQTDSILYAKGEAKGKGVDKKDLAKIEKIFTEYAKEKEEADEKFKKELDAEVEKYRGKDIPFSVISELGYEVTSVKFGKLSKLNNVSEDRKVEFYFKIKITDVSKLNVSHPFERGQKAQVLTPIVFINSTGKILQYSNYQSVYFDKIDIQNGDECSQTGSFYLNADNAADFADFKKMVFIMKLD
ncbi:MAG: hypothetical protein LBD59_12560 [Prevotellaceae bacterium]|jgi:hypothetical protein|nr:hypothetical protein [Prevotellaceae bacterium]